MSQNHYLIVYCWPSGAYQDIVPRTTRISFSVPAFFTSASSVRDTPSLVSYLKVDNQIIDKYL